MTQLGSELGIFSWYIFYSERSALL